MPTPGVRPRLALALGSVALVLAALLAPGLLRRAPAPAERSVAAATGCDRCHDRADEGPTGLHALFPCEICHGGDPRASTVLDAHRGMEVEAGALDVAGRACGPCHRREVSRVKASPMATGRGLLAVDRWAFGETARPDGEQTFTQLLAELHPTPAQDHLRRLCTGCHLNTRKDNRDDAITSGGSGCGACHSGPPVGSKHSSLDGHVPSERCFGCHSRSSRISLSYQGLAEVSGPQADACEEKSTLPDGRTVCAITPDVHHEAGMACTDCHLHSELMGDGRTYLHAEDAVEVSCRSCHGPTRKGEEATWWDVRDTVTSAMLRLRTEWRPDREPVRLGRRGTPLWNLRSKRRDGSWTLYRKADGRPLPVTPTPDDAAHTLPGHERLSCAACHAASAPTCPTCHTTFDPEGVQWDFGAAAERPGEWIETNEGMGSAPPGLAVGADGRVRPAIPGMRATLDARPAGGRLRRIHLFSVLDPHTTVRRSRSCVSCHADPDALLTGRGTRRGARAFDAAERRRILRVGRCLKCHEGSEPMYRRFATAVGGLEPGHPAGRRRAPDGGRATAPGGARIPRGTQR